MNVDFGIAKNINKHNGCLINENKSFSYFVVVKHTRDSM